MARVETPDGLVLEYRRLWQDISFVIEDQTSGTQKRILRYNSKPGVIVIDPRTGKVISNGN